MKSRIISAFLEVIQVCLIAGCTGNEQELEDRISQLESELDEYRSNAADSSDDGNATYDASEEKNAGSSEKDNALNDFWDGIPECPPADLEYEEADGLVTISKYKGDSAIVRIPGEIDGKRVTSIDEGAFGNCTQLTDILIPDSVESIGFAAFNCTALKSVVIPDSVTELNWQVFQSCTSLESVTLPNSLTEIPNCIFRGCTSLNSVSVPDGVTVIKKGAFMECTSLTSVSLPDSLTEIHDSAFMGCTSLSEITIPDNVTYIGRLAFEDCTGLREVVLPDSVEQIWADAFRGCENISVTYKGKAYTYDNIDEIYNCLA